MTSAVRQGWWSRMAQSWSGRKPDDKLPVRDQVPITPLRNTSLAGFDLGLWQKSLAVNLTGPVLLVRDATDALVASGQRDLGVVHRWGGVALAMPEPLVATTQQMH